jgi:broad specificity phosphatase PhoE
LSPQGIIQAEWLRDRLVNSGEIKPDVFISSPERGAHETAKIIEPVMGIKRPMGHAGYWNALTIVITYWDKKRKGAALIHTLHPVLHYS